MKENKRFIIDQLRKDKIIYATEACATGIICLFAYFFVNQYVPGMIGGIFDMLLIIIAVGYGIYMGVGNYKRLMKIRELEKELKILI